MSDVVRVAMWSGPRNISTAMMRAFENRPDTVVVDEPLYAAYLARTGIDHPVRDEVIASQPTDLAAAVAGLLRAAAARRDRPLRQAHGAPRLARHGPALDAGFRNVLLIRDPAEVVASYVRARETCEPDDIGLPQQGWLLELWDEHGVEVPIIDARRLPARARGAPALAVRLARHPVHRPDAVLAAGPRDVRRRVGAALVRRRLVVHRLRAVAPAGDDPLRPRRRRRRGVPPDLRGAARPQDPTTVGGAHPLLTDIQ